MDKDYDINLSEENKSSVMSNEELRDITSYNDYSNSLVASSSFGSPNGIYNYNDTQYSSHLLNKWQPPSNDLISNMHLNPGSSSDKALNPPTQDDLLRYFDQLTSYLYKYDRGAMEYLENRIISAKNGELLERSTPLLFITMHALAKLDFPALIYQMMPSSLYNQYGGIIEISDEIYPKYYNFHIDDYPGPLTTERTSEDQISYYLNNLILNDLNESSLFDVDSGHLLLNYLKILIKENGSPRISDIVKLLNDGIETRTADLRQNNQQIDSISRNSYSRASSRAISRACSRAASPENRELVDNDLPQNVLDYPRGPGSVASVMRRAVNNASRDLKLCQNMDKFRECIWSGRFEEAINFAIRAEIWDHAFALALRMNKPALVNEILLRFSRRAISSNDPLFTMHELMAAKPPRIVAANRGFSNSEMADWRSHLSMIEVVKKFQPEESRQAIESMGDKLLLLHNYVGAHLCFLLAGTGFGIDKSASKYRRKFDLIGWHSSTSSIPIQKSTYENCHKSFSGFNYWNSAPEQCIQLTEIYEYALKLRGDDSDRSLSVHLIPYKYLMAFRMLDRQQTKKAYEYCRNIGEILAFTDVEWIKCESVNFSIVRNIRDLSYKLHSLLTCEEDSNDTYLTNDSSWLNNIDIVYCQFCHKYNLWNPMQTKSEFFIDQMLNANQEDVVDSASDTCSQMTQEFSAQNITQSSGSNPGAFYSQQQPPQNNVVNQRFVLPQTHLPNMNQRDQHNPTNFQEKPSLSNTTHNVEQSRLISKNTFEKVEQTQNRFQPIPFRTTEVQEPELVKQPQPNQSFVSNNFAQVPPAALESSHSRLADMKATRHFSNDGPVTDGILNDYSALNRQSTFNPEPNPSLPPILPSKSAIDSKDQYNSYHGSTNQFKPSMFVPGSISDSPNTPDTIDCFTASRSRSQSISSVGVVDSQQNSTPRQSISTSQNNSELNELRMPPPSKPLESTKEETESDKHKKLNNDSNPSEEHKNGWGLFKWIKPKSAHLPDDTEPTIQFDPVKNCWIDKSNPDADKPSTPPPIMPQHQMLSLNPSPNFYPGNQSALSKYRPASVNVKQPVNVPSASVPTFKMPPTFTVHNQINHPYNSHESVKGKPFSRVDNSHSFHNNQISTHRPQSHDSSNFQDNEE